MALTVSSSASVNVQSNWLRVSKPSGVSYGDLLIAYSCLDNDGSLSVMTAPYGWNQIAGYGARSYGYAKSWYKWATYTEPDHYTFGGVYPADGIVTICRITGVTDPSNVKIDSNINLSTNTHNHYSPTMLINDTDSLYIALWGGNVNASNTWTLPGGFTNRGLSLSQSTWLQGVVASRSGATGYNGPYNCTSSPNWLSGYGDFTGAIVISQQSSGAGVSGSIISAIASMSASATVSGAPGIFPSLTVDHYVDWQGNGNFTDTGDDVGNRILGRESITINSGRDQSRSLSPIKPGVVSGIALDNTSRDYSPDNGSSPLSGNIIPARPYKIVVTWLGKEYILWNGHFDDFDVDPTPGSQRVSVTAVDALQDMSASVSTQLYLGIRSGDAINYVLDTIGWPTNLRDIDSGASVFRYWWEDGVNAWDALQKIVNSEGPPAVIYIDYQTGNFVFRDRTHRIINSESTTVQETFQDSGTDPRFSWPLGYSVGWKDVINNVTFTVNDRAPLDPTVVWETDSQFNLTANQVISLIATASDPFINAIVPAEDIDYVVASGSVDVSIGQDSGQSTLITITESAGSTAIVQGMKLRANSVAVKSTYTIKSVDGASQGAYGVQSFPLDAPWASQGDAQAIADIIVAMRAQRLPTVSVKLTGGTPDIQTSQFEHHISHRVHVTDASEAGTGFDSDCFIEQIQHTIRGTGNKIIETVYGCEKIGPVIDNPSTVFRFGISPNGKFGTGIFGH
jgi:hypothetical protein